MGWKVNLHSEKTIEGFFPLKEYGIPRASKYMKVDLQWLTRNVNKNRMGRNVNKGELDIEKDKELHRGVSVDEKGSIRCLGKCKWGGYVEVDSIGLEGI